MIIKIMLILLVFLGMDSSQCQDYISQKIFIKTGKDMNAIEPIEEFNGLLSFGGFSVDEDRNIYIVNWGDSSIKKFDKNGEFKERIKIKNTFFFDLYSFNGKLYALDKANYNNDLYIFNQKNLKHYEVKKKIYSREPGEQDNIYWDGILIIDILDHFHVFDLSLNKMFYNLKHPIEYFKYKPKEIKEFFKKKVKLNFYPLYLGEKDNSYIFFKPFYGIFEVYELAIIKYVHNNFEITKSLFHFNRSDDTMGVVFNREIKFHKNGTIYIYGYEKNKLVINVIDLNKIFSQVNKTNYGRKYIVEEFKKYSLKELTIKRNEIYARHGKVFRTRWLQEYFEKQPWYYKNLNYDNLMLKDNEKEMISIIKYVEKLKE